jgi:hypothetical protein
MTIESIVILLVVAAGTVAALALPIVQNRTGMYRGKQYLEQLSYDELLTEYERVLVMIRDLDEDHNMGKLDLEQYQYEREYWAKQGVTLLQKLEARGMKRPTKNIPQATESDPEMDLAIEEAIAAYRKARTEASGAS